jgi:hypothetical protein
MTKKVGYKIILILASIGVFPLIKVSPINPHMHRLLLGGGGGFFFWSQFLLCTLLWERHNKGVMRSSLGSVFLVVALSAEELNFDKFKSGGLHERHAVATWNLGTISAFA